MLNAEKFLQNTMLASLVFLSPPEHASMVNETCVEEKVLVFRGNLFSIQCVHTGRFIPLREIR